MRFQYSRRVLACIFTAVVAAVPALRALDLPRDLEAAQRTPAGATPAIEITATEKLLGDVVREFIGRAHLENILLVTEGAVWKKKVTVEGKYSPREFFAMARRSYGVVAKAPGKDSELWVVTDISNDALQVEQIYELHGMLDTAARELAREPDGLERFRKSIVDVVTVPPADGVTEPAPTVHYSYAGDFLTLRGLPEQQARLAAYLAKADRDPHRFFLSVHDSDGRDLLTVSHAPEAVAQIGARSVEGQAWELAVTPYLTGGSKPTVRLKGSFTLNGRAEPFDVAVKPDGTALLIEHLRIAAQVAVVD